MASTPRAIDKDVWGPNQQTVSDNLISSCNSLWNMLSVSGAGIDGGATTAKQDFSGYFADLFDRNMGIRSTDQSDMMGALQAIISGLRDAQNAAQQEQKRIERAREWQREHDKWQADRDNAIWETWYDWWHAEPEINTSDLAPGPTPTITFSRPTPKAHDVPWPGSGGGGCSTSSARPDKLKTFVMKANSAADQLDGPIRDIDGAYQDFEAGWTWKDGSVTIQGMDDFIASVRKYNDWNREDAKWIEAIANAFIAAGSEGAVVTLSNQALAQAITASGANAARQHIDIPKFALIGMTQTTGYADDPINTATGNFIEPESDLVFTQASNLSLDRMYNSILALAQIRNDPEAADVGMFGVGWSSVLDQRIEMSSDGIIWVRADGRYVYFPVPDGTEQVRASRESFWLGAIDADSKQWLVSDNSGNVWTFTVSGDLATISSGPGTTVTVIRDSEGFVTALEHERGRRIDLEYVDGRVAVAMANDGRRVEYDYEGAHLVGVSTAQGRRNYHHDDAGLLDKVISNSGVIELVNTYDDLGRVRSQESDFGRVSRYAYLQGNITVVSDMDGDRSNTWIADNQGRTVGVIDSDDQRQSMSYDRYGNLIRSVDREGKTTTRFYNDRGHEIRTILPTGGELHFEWDDLDRLTMTVAENGSIVRYEYDADEDRNPSRVINPKGGVTHFEWENDLLRGISSPTGVTVTLDYNEFGELISSANTNGDTTRLVRDAAGHVIKSITPLGHTTKYEYDEAGNVVRRRDPEGVAWNFEYDAHGRMTASIDPYGATTRIQYGDHGRASKLIDPLGRVTEREFDDLGNVRALTLPDGAQFVFEHDALSRLLSITNPDGATWKQDWDAVGNPIGVTDPTGVSTQISGNLAAGAVSSRNGDGSSNGVIEFDSYGRPVKNTDPAGDAEIVTYDETGQPVELLDADGGLTKIDRDITGRIIQITSAEGHVTKYDYDSCGRLAQLIEPNGGATRFTYDADSRLISRINPEGEESTYTYDRSNRLVEAVIPGQGKSRWAYDKCGRVTFHQDLLTGIRRFVYDAAGQLVKATNGLGGTTHYEYDLRGHVVKITDPLGGVTKRSYNKIGQVSSVTDQLGRTTTATYDAAGRQTSQTNADGSTISLAYNANGELESSYANDKLLSKIKYDPITRTATVEDHTGKNGEVTHLLKFNRLGKLVSKIIQANDDETRAEWEYNRDGQRTAYRTENGSSIEYFHNESGELASAIHSDLGVASLNYDLAGRLIGIETGQVKNSWHYDDGFITRHVYSGEDGVEDGTRIERDTFGRVTAITTTTQRISYSYDGAGQLVELSATNGEHRSWKYDQAGRLTESTHNDQATKFEYDAASQLVSVHLPTNKIIRYEYDATGQRVLSASDEKTTRYQWDVRGSLVRLSIEHDGDTTSIDTHVDALGQLATINDTTLQWDVAATLPNLSSIDGDSLFHLPGVTLGTDIVADAWRPQSMTDPLDPYGGSLGGFDSHLPDNVQLTAGGTIAIAGLEWMGARLYDPNTASFLTQDPIAAPPATLWATSAYNYAANTPLSLADPYGLSPITDSDISALTAYNDSRNRGIGGFLADNWEYGLAGLAIIGGVALAATGVGGILVAGALAGGLVGGGTSLLTQKISNKSIDWKEVGIAATVGAVTGLVSMGVSNLIGAKMAQASPAAQKALLTHQSAAKVQTAGRGLWSRMNGTSAIQEAVKYEAKNSLNMATDNFTRKLLGDMAGEIVSSNAGYATETLIDANKNFTMEGLATTNAKSLLNATTKAHASALTFGVNPMPLNADTASVGEKWGRGIFKGAVDTTQRSFNDFVGHNIKDATADKVDGATMSVDHSVNLTQGIASGIKDGLGK